MQFRELQLILVSMKISTLKFNERHKGTCRVKKFFKKCRFLILRTEEKFEATKTHYFLHYYSVFRLLTNVSIDPLGTYPCHFQKVMERITENEESTYLHDCYFSV